MSSETPVEQSEARNWTVAVWVLYLGGHITGDHDHCRADHRLYEASAIRGHALQSHMTSAIRTFWIALIGGIIGGVLVFVLVGIPLLIALAIWTIFRCVRGLVRAINGQPIDNPEGWL